MTSPRLAAAPSTQAPSVHLLSRLITRNNALVMCIVVASSMLLLLILCLGSATSSAAFDPKLSKEDLIHLIDSLRGDDGRLMRWNAERHTRKRQHASDDCNALPDAMDIMISSGSDTKLQSLACEYATFCITDNPEQRSILSQHDGVHKALVKLVESPDSLLSAMASHVVYIASFANKVNCQGFYKANAVAALGKVILNEKATPLQLMWAASALQNLAASYCETENDGRCYWGWYEDEAHVLVEQESLPVVWDGTSVRKVAVAIPGLVERLVELACHGAGPVRGKMSETNIYVGENAIAGTHDDSPNIVPWAATGALKNLALEPDANLLSHENLVCFCRMAHSADWLEENKGRGVLHHLRRADPCWFQNEQTDKFHAHGPLCLDGDFLDAEGYLCDAYGEATTEECNETKDPKTGQLAKEACCACGGGTRVGIPPKEEL